MKLKQIQAKIRELRPMSVFVLSVHSKKLVIKMILTNS